MSYLRNEPSFEGANQANPTNLQTELSSEFNLKFLHEWKIEESSNINSKYDLNLIELDYDMDHEKVLEYNCGNVL